MQRGKLHVLINSTHKGNLFKKAVIKAVNIQEIYKDIRSKHTNNIHFCLKYLFKMSQNNLIHHLVGMKDLTTVEKYYISSLNNK